MLASIGLKAFLLPNGFLDGGATGIAILISELTPIPISWVLLGVSIPFLVLAWFSLSRMTVFKSVFSILILALFIHFENFSVVTEDKLLIAIFGGLFLGAGIGMAIRNGAVLDGSEILGIYIYERMGISIGKVILMFNFILFAITALVLPMEVAMYSILTYLVTGKVIDLSIEGFEDFVGIMITSHRSAEIQEELTEKLGVGFTVYPSVKGYGKNGVRDDIEVIHLVINRVDMRKTSNIISEIDPKAFIIEFHVNDVKGGLLQKYLNTRGLQKLAST